MTPPAIELHGIGKRYRRGALNTNVSLREALSETIRAIGAMSRPKIADARDFWALQDISFSVAPGENVGVIGLNGAGKSTLLKILSRIATPTTGRACLRGRLGALIEVGTGFHRELTGRENVFLYGAILGMGRAETARKFDAIVDFAEIGEFIDTPVKHYSSGMYVRLAFAVAAHLDPDILMLDEVLAVGDYGFQRKCIAFAKGLEEKGSTILFVSHNMHQIRTMCTRAIYLKKGQLVFDGAVEDALRLYEADSLLAQPPWLAANAKAGAATAIEGFELLDRSGQARASFERGERPIIRLSVRSAVPVPNAHVLVSVNRIDGVRCENFSSDADGVRLQLPAGRSVVEIALPPIALTAHRYSLSAVLHENGFRTLLDAANGPSFDILDPQFDAQVFGVFHEAAEWRTPLALDDGEAA